MQLKCLTAYTGARFGIYVEDRTATEYFLVDGGFTNWTQQLLSDRKERLLISGLGSERFVSCSNSGNISGVKHGQLGVFVRNCAIAGLFL
jgi:hypothetical protein